MHQKKLAPRPAVRYRLGMAPKTPAPVAVSYRIRRETRDRIKRLADEHGLKIERLVDQLLTAALDLREVGGSSLPGSTGTACGTSA